MKPPTLWASLVAATLGLAPAFIRLIESASNPAWLSWLYAVWLVSWILTASTLLWLGWQRGAPRVRRRPHAMTGASMLLALVAFAQGPSTGAAALAMLAAAAIVAGAAMGFFAAKELAPIRRSGWLVAAVGGAILGLGAFGRAVMVAPERVQMALAAGSFLLGAGLSLALGVEEPERPPTAATRPHEH